MTPTHTGSCHCGRIGFEFDGDVSAAIVCNCSLCSGIGAVWFGVEDAHFRLFQWLDDARAHQFGTMTAKHYFCPECGFHPFSRPRLAPHAWAVNLRCVPSIDVATLAITPFDGRNWEAAAARWRKGRGGKRASHSAGT